VSNRVIITLFQPISGGLDILQYRYRTIMLIFLVNVYSCISMNDFR